MRKLVRGDVEAGRRECVVFFRLLPAVLGNTIFGDPKQFGMLVKPWENWLLHLLSRLCRTNWG